MRQIHRCLNDRTFVIEHVRRSILMSLNVRLVDDTSIGPVSLVGRYGIDEIWRTHKHWPSPGGEHHNFPASSCATTHQGVHHSCPLTEEDEHISTTQ